VLIETAPEPAVLAPDCNVIDPLPELDELVPNNRLPASLSFHPDINPIEPSDADRTIVAPTDVEELPTLNDMSPEASLAVPVDTRTEPDLPLIDSPVKSSTFPELPSSATPVKSFNELLSLDEAVEIEVST